MQCSCQDGFQKAGNRRQSKYMLLVTFLGLHRKKSHKIGAGSTSMSLPCRDILGLAIFKMPLRTGTYFETSPIEQIGLAIPAFRFCSEDRFEAVRFSLQLPDSLTTWRDVERTPTPSASFYIRHTRLRTMQQLPMSRGGSTKACETCASVITTTFV